MKRLISSESFPGSAIGSRLSIRICCLTSAEAARSRGVAGLCGCADPADLFEDLGGGFVVAVLVVPPPPLVRRRLRVALRRVLPLYLTPEDSDVEVVPSVPHLLVAAAVDEVGAEYAVAVAYERVRAVPFIHAEVLVEAVRDRVPRDELPAHSCLQARDVSLRRARGERECGIAGIQMSGVSDLIGHHGAANACMFGPADHARLEKRAVNN